VAERLKVIAC